MTDRPGELVAAREPLDESPDGHAPGVGEEVEVVHERDRRAGQLTGNVSEYARISPHFDLAAPADARPHDRPGPRRAARGLGPAAAMCQRRWACWGAVTAWTMWAKRWAASSWTSHLTMTGRPARSRRAREMAAGAPIEIPSSPQPLIARPVRRPSRAPKACRRGRCSPAPRSPRDSPRRPPPRRAGRARPRLEIAVHQALGVVPGPVLPVRDGAYSAGICTYRKSPSSSARKTG